MNHVSGPVMLMLVGVALMVLAPLVIGAAPQGTLAHWSDADQAALQRASAEFHAVNSAAANGPRGSVTSSGGDRFDPVAAKARHATAKAELEKQQARLNAAQARPGWVLWSLRLLGVALAGAGVWGYFWNDRGELSRPDSHQLRQQKTGKLPTGK